MENQALFLMSKITMEHRIDPQRTGEVWPLVLCIEHELAATLSILALRGRRT
jgi:hypothetical protein